MNVILSSNIHHYNYAARAFDAAGALNTYITGAQFARQPFFMRLLPEAQRNLVSQRTDAQLAEGKLRSMWLLEMVYKSLLKVNGVSRDKVVHYHNEAFDWLASRQLTSCQYFHFVSSIGYRSALKAKSKGAKIILDERAEHPLYLADLMAEERIRLQLASPAASLSSSSSTSSSLSPAQSREQEMNPVTAKMLREYEIADFIIVASEYAKKTFVQQGMSPGRMFVLPYGCDSGLFYPQAKRDDTFRVISVGQITPRKGTAYLIEAFKKLPAHQTELVLIGRVDPVMEPFMRDLPANIVHHPSIPNNKLNDYYTNASVFVLGSLSDSFGLVVLEAMNAGLPVIVTDHVGAADTVIDGVNGFVVPIRESQALFGKLEWLRQHPERQEEMAVQALKQAKQFGWERYMKQLIRIYEEIAAHA